MDVDFNNSSLTLSPNSGKQNTNISGSYLTQSFREQHQIDGFIRSSKIIKIVKIEAENFFNIYQTSKRPEDGFNAIIIKFPFVYSDFLNHSLDLLHFVIEEPVQFADALKYCVFSMLRDIIKDLSKTTEIKNILNIDVDQVHVLIRFMGLPLQQDLFFQPHINLYRTGLTEVVGILSAVKEPEKVVFREQHQIDGFIRSSKIIKIVKIEAENFFNIYQTSKRPEDGFNAIIIKFPFVYSDFLNHSLDLLHFVIEEPVQFADALKYCVFSMLRDIIKDLSKTTEIKNILNIDVDQVHVLIRFMGLPLQQDLFFQPHINLYRTGLTEVVGILSAVKEPEKVVIQSVWYCSTGCGRNKIRTLSLDVPNCSNCRHPMSEFSKLRHTQNFHLIRILPVESIESPHKLNKLFRALTVRVLDHVSESQLILGERYFIIGYYNYLSQKQEFEAWNLTII